MNNAVWLVDMGYVVKAANGVFPLDYVKTVGFLSARFGPTRAFVFNGYDKNIAVPSGLAAFYFAMEEQGMVVRTHPMSGHPALGTHTQRRVDVDLAAHLVWQASLADTAHIILTTGDQDFLPAVDLVNTWLKKPIALMTYRHNVSKELISRVSEHLFFEDFRAEVCRP